MSSNQPNATASASNASITDGPRSVPNSDRRATSSNAPRTGVVQPKPQALSKRTGPASIIVSPRQKGNPVIAAIKSMPWEYGDIPADFVLGVTTCALFLSLKYHKLHPEYIYNRIKALQGKYALRIVLVLVDISNHEESLKELSKTSLINNVTLVLTWSSAECARYIELFKTYEHAPPTSIKQHQSNKYGDRMQDFIATPRSINKADAISLVSQFGSLRTAVNARHEDVAGIAGWGDVKVKAWTGAVRQGFRTARAKKRRVGELALPIVGGEESVASRDGTPNEASRPASAMDRNGGPSPQQAGPFQIDDENDPVRGEAEALAALKAMESAYCERPILEKEPAVPKQRKPDDDLLNDGVMAALSKLRKDGG